MAEHPDCADPGIGDLLAAYELGLLDSDDDSRVERHVGTCEACQEALYATAPTAVALREEPERYRRAAGSGPGHRAEPVSAGWWQRLGGFLSPRVLVPVATAAAAVVALLLFLPADGPRLAELARVEPVPYAVMQTRSDASAADDLFHEAMSSYVTGDYGTAATQLGRALETAAGDDWRLVDQARFYRGLSLLLAGRAQSALAPLAAAESEAPRPLAERAAWFRAQAHLVLGDGIAAREILIGLTDSPVYGDPARTQLAELAAALD